jgi:hypothetical protein
LPDVFFEAREGFFLEVAEAASLRLALNDFFELAEANGGEFAAF